MATRYSNPIADIDLALNVRWSAIASGKSEDLQDATLGRLKIEIGEQSATAFRTDKGDVGDEILIPQYDLAEWIASNWWALLNEPRKSDEAEDDAGYRSRHWLGSARDGFALPDMWINPAGGFVEIAAHPIYLRYARVNFLNEIFERVETTKVQQALRTYIQHVITRLNDSGQKATTLHLAWNMIAETPKDAEFFCTLVGALGLSPYDENPEIEKLLDSVSDRLPKSVLHDLCQASEPRSLLETASVVRKTVEAISRLDTVDLTPLCEITFPADHSSAAWRWGLDAVHRVREELGISASDPRGGDRFLEALTLDPTRNYVKAARNGIDPHVTGLIRRDETSMQLAVVDQQIPQQRFTAARGAFLGWASERNRARLVTAARTREQQASRAFAAELLAPIAYIRKKAPQKYLSTYRIEDIAHDLEVSPIVVSYQARNNHLHIANL